MYSENQIAAVRELQRLHEVPGYLTDEACIQYLDWHLATQTASARGITSIEQARTEGFCNGLNHHEEQFRMRSLLAVSMESPSCSH